MFIGIINFTLYFSAVLFIIYLIGFTRNSKAYRFFTAYLFLISVIQILSLVIIKTTDLSNLFLSHYYFIGQFILLSLFFYEFIKHKIIYWILGFVLIFSAYQYISNPPLYSKYNQMGMFITHAIIIVYSIMFLYKALTRKLEFTIVNVGILIYFLSSSLIFASGNLVFDLQLSSKTTTLLTDANVLLYLTFQIMILVEWLRNYRKSIRN